MDSSLQACDDALISNISAYKFVRLAKLTELRSEIKRLCQAGALKGTVLISHEGINLFLAGTQKSTKRFLSQLRLMPEFCELQVKVSLSARQPFRRLLVKIKKEIIAFDNGCLNPSDFHTPKVDARTLKQWLDEGRSVKLLDVRNDYEVRLGAFRDAITIDIDNFRQFPQRVGQLPEDLKQHPIVTYCTGGIRCEKAGPYLQQIGFREVYQLEGGILKYFEHCGGAHYEGECFVFDHRVALDDTLCETDTALCFACQAALTHDDQASPQYVPGKSCPYCFVPPEAALARTLEERHTAIRRICNPLPGSVPYENRRPMQVSAKRDGWTLIDFVVDLHPHVARDEWERVVQSGRIQRQSVTLSSETRLRAGDRIEHVIPQTIEPDVNSHIRILHEDDWIVVANKPAPLPMHPCGRFNRNTLIRLLDQVYRPQRLRVVHRLDANTTGVVVLARTRAVAATLRAQFVDGLVEKRYLVRVTGQPTQESFSVDLAIGDEAKGSGARHVDRMGRAARTEFKFRRSFSDGSSLLEARPQTGRTNQIRLHLAEVGLPVVGDPLYHPIDGQDRMPTLAVDDPPLCLHAWEIAIRHPARDEQVSFVAPPPGWAGSST